MQNLSFEEKFKNYLRASYPLLYIRTHEEGRVTRSIINALNDATIPISIYSWDSKRLLEKHNKSANGAQGGSWEQVKGTPGKDYGLANVIDNIKGIGSTSGRNVIIMKDFHSFIEAPGQIRPIRNAIEELKCKGNMIVFVSPIIKIPVELEKDIQILDYHLPDDKQLEGILMSVQAIFNKKQKDKGRPEQALSEDIKQASIEAAKGLTFGEAHDAFSLSIIENHEFNNEFVLSVFEEKVKQVKRNGLLQYIKTGGRFDNIGGMEGLKKWARARGKAYSTAARAYKLPYPKGILLCGIPGCGKTEFAKAIANEFGFPLFQLDIGALFGKFVGESEENFRKVIEVVESIGRCVLFIDEIEKSLNRSATSGAGDTGTSSRAFATLLTWLSDHKSPVFVIGTSNDHTRLPTEFVRKGRFDEIFWLDLPSPAEREKIFEVLLARYGRKIEDIKGGNLKKLAEETAGFTGAEIEQAIIGTMAARFDKDGKEFTQTDILDELKAVIPISVTAKEDIEQMRNKAAGKLRVVNSSGASRIFQLENVEKRSDASGDQRRLDTEFS